ncbi:putative transcriptional regulator [Balneicella halophila]|uniref:Putative transcriptional regulator n=1 Tax=Balneicella halophila TaxID=1537566 RepID=A0A7L4UT44_BALHA|nr:BlaI/MecI/CopY family transcriptional regulator [Balneicella halophila]PVX52467.1 putative transcriptional regulator [Balneicella halophila]
MKELTKAEEQIMQELWKLEKAYVKNIIEQLPEPKPAYNTVSTIVRILERKGFVSHEACGKSHLYYPIIAKDNYKKAFVKHFVKDYFSNSFQNMVSFFANNKEISVNELEEIQALIDKQLKEQKK